MAFTRRITGCRCHPPLRMEYYRPSTNAGEFVINGVSIPLQVNVTQGGYLNLNDYRKIVISNPRNLITVVMLDPLLIMTLMYSTV